jgi:hypothetical protein
MLNSKLNVQRNQTIPLSLNEKDIEKISNSYRISRFGQRCLFTALKLCLSNKCILFLPTNNFNQNYWIDAFVNTHIFFTDNIRIEIKNDSSWLNVSFRNVDQTIKLPGKQYAKLRSGSIQSIKLAFLNGVSVFKVSRHLRLHFKIMDSQTLLAVHLLWIDIPLSIPLRSIKVRI